MESIKESPMESPKHTLFITGAAGYVGTMLVHQFSKRADVDHMICIDKEPLPEMIKELVDASKYTWINANMSDDGWQEKVAAKNPDIVIHTAWQIREMYGDQKTQWKWNVTGTDMVFDFAFNTPSVKRLIHFSTVASYAAYADNTIDHFFTEAEPFRESDYLYAIEKDASEKHLEEKYQLAIEAKRKAGVSDPEKAIPQVAIIRPAAITGPRGRYTRIRFGLQSALSGQLNKSNLSHRIVSKLVSWVPITPKWCRQFIHEDDITNITEILAFDNYEDRYEAYNACPPGEVVLGKDMASAVGKKALPVHPWLIRIVFFFAWHLSQGAIPTSRGGWKSYSYPIVVDGSKFSRKFNYKYFMAPKEAFVKKEGRYMEFVK